MAAAVADAAGEKRDLRDEDSGHARRNGAAVGNPSGERRNRIEFANIDGHATSRRGVLFASDRAAVDDAAGEEGQIIDKNAEISAGRR